jgi:hypothetical protein
VREIKVSVIHLPEFINEVESCIAMKCIDISMHILALWVGLIKGYSNNSRLKKCLLTLKSTTVVSFLLLWQKISIECRLEII